MEDKINRLEKENQRLRGALEELSILNEIATAIGSTLTLNEIVDLMVQKCVKHFQVEQAAVMMLNREKSEDPFQTMIRRANTTSEILPYRLNAQLTGWMLRHQKPLVINDLQNDERFHGFVDNSLPIHSLLSVPLMAKGKIIGLINAFNKKSEEGFDNNDQRLLAIIATQSAQVLENARLLAEEQALLRMREEMRTAHDIQLKLLPTAQPKVADPDYDIAGVSIPAKEVGGDYYDFIKISDSRLAFGLGDVTGKGIPAALLMANVQATIRSQTFMIDSARRCMGNANKLMYESTDLGKFVTMFYGILDTDQHTLSYCNAGHDLPYLYTIDDVPKRLDTGGIVLGFVPEYNYAEDVVDFKAGSRLVLYSDGITEAMNAKDEEFGEDRLKEVIVEFGHLTSLELVEKIIDAVQQHAGKTPQSDDMTLLIITRKK